MLVSALRPKVGSAVEFLWSSHGKVPEVPGCYAITTYDQLVLYVGLASKSLRARLGSHLDDRKKRLGANGSIAYWFHYVPADAYEVEAIERGWLNQSILIDGVLPPLNRVHSPI